MWRLDGFFGNDGVNWTYLKVCGKPECATEARADGIRKLSVEERKEKFGKSWDTLNADPTRKAAAIEAQKAGNMKVGADGLTGFERTAIKRRKTLLEKYGDEYYANAEKASRTKNEWTEEQRAQNLMNRSAAQMAIPAEKKKEYRVKAEETCVSRNGKPAWKIAYDSSKGRRSGISERFFNSVQNLMDAPLVFGAVEFSLISENGTKYYDLVNHETKKIVEFNGDYWHANPQKYKAEDNLRKSTAQQIWDADAAKIKLAEDNGYQVKIVWESEYKKNPQKIIEECKQWLMM